MSTPEQKAKALAYYYAHRERILERQRERYRNDEDYREYRLKQANEWYRDNPTQAYHSHREWASKNKDKIKAYLDNWYAKNKERKREYSRKYAERRKANA